MGLKTRTKKFTTQQQQGLATSFYIFVIAKKNCRNIHFVIFTPLDIVAKVIEPN